MPPFLHGLCLSAMLQMLVQFLPGGTSQLIAPYNIGVKPIFVSPCAQQQQLSVAAVCAVAHVHVIAVSTALPVQPLPTWKEVSATLFGCVVALSYSLI